MSLNTFHWSAHMLDGVPFVIKHRPVVAVDLPSRLNVINYPDVLLEEYDFSFEKKLLTSPPKKPTPTKSDTLEQISPVIEPKVLSSRLPILSDQILVPIKMDNTCGGVSQKKSNATAITGALDAVTLKDFDKIDDPFDSVELKSINERVELETLFGADSHLSTESIFHSQHTLPQASSVAVATLPSSVAVATLPCSVAVATLPSSVAVATLPSSVAVATLPSSQVVDTLTIPAETFRPLSVTLADPSSTVSSKVVSSVAAHELSIIEQLCAMGFPRNRVARALRAMGCDNERALLDHLCLAQHLVETRGLEPLEAEAALHLFENDEKRALQYCAMRREFTSMGYSHEQVSEALVMSSLDRGQALRLLKQQ